MGGGVKIVYVLRGEARHIKKIPRESQKKSQRSVTRLCVAHSFWEKESIHRPAAVMNVSLPKNGGDRGKILVVDMVFLVFIGFLYLPPAWKVFFDARKVLPMILCWWWWWW